MKQHPLISVIMPTYQAGALVYEAIDSILAQSYPCLDILIIDDGSTDGTAEALDALNIANLHVFQQQRQGPSAARNVGLSHSKGELITFLDADDIWLPGKLTRQIQLLRDNPDASIIIGNTEGFGANVDENKRRLKANWASRQLLQLGALMVRKSVFDQIGGFDTSLRYAEDIDWTLRAKQAGFNMLEHSDTVLRYRRHQHNMTNDIHSRDKGFIAALRKNLERKRNTE